jgi:hypothetical protein
MTVVAYFKSQLIRLPVGSDLKRFEQTSFGSLNMDANDVSLRGLLSEEWQAKCQSPTSSITSAQWFWIWKHAIVCAMVAFGVNFGLTTATFYGKDDPTLWEFPTPVAGTYAITVFIEITLNWFINGIVMTLEIKHGKIPPLDPSGLSWGPSCDTSPWFRWYLNLSDLILPSVKSKQTEEDKGPSFLWKFYCTHLRSLPWMVITGVTLLPLYTLITWLLYGEENYNDFPQPELLTAIFGFFLAIFTMPIWAIMTLAHVGERFLAVKATSVI